MELTKTEYQFNDENGTLPNDVCGIIDYYISYKLDKGLSNVGEGYILPLPFVGVLKMILRDYGIPCDYEEQLPEPCRCQISNVVWDNVDEIIRMSKKFQEEQKEKNNGR